MMKAKISTVLSTINNIINKGHDRSVKAKKNIIATIMIRGASIVISLFLVPITIHYVSPSQYGIWITLSSIIGWFGFFDIGFGNGLRNKFAECVAIGEHEKARIYVSTTYAILSIIIAIVLIIFLSINPFLNWSKILNAPANMMSELSTLALIVFVFFCLQFVMQLITTILTADQQPAKASLFNFLGSLFSLLIILILTRTTSGNLIYLGAVYSSTPILVLALSSIWFYSNKYKRYAPSIKLVKFEYARGLMTLGLKFFIIQIASVVFYQTSNIIISQLFGPEQVTPYNIAFKYFSIIPMVFTIIIAPFWSAFTEAWSKNDKEWITKIMKRLKLFWTLLIAIALVMFISSSFIYKMWVGKEIVVPISLSAVVAFYVVINAWNGIHSNFLNGVGKIKLQLYIALIGSLINIPLAILLGKELGIYGVVLATTLISLMSSILLPLQYNKIMNNMAQGIWAK
jgi:O-antigen/teichoic acid export membrane protein